MEDKGRKAARREREYATGRLAWEIHSTNEINDDDECGGPEGKKGRRAREGSQVRRGSSKWIS
jgi:hypothetical protein